MLVGSNFVVDKPEYLSINLYLEKTETPVSTRFKTAGQVLTSSNGKKTPWYIFCLSEDPITTQTLRIPKAISIEPIDSSWSIEKIFNVAKEFRIIIVQGGQGANALVHKSVYEKIKDFVTRTDVPNLKPVAVKIPDPTAKISYIEMNQNVFNPISDLHYAIILNALGNLKKESHIKSTDLQVRSSIIY